MIVHPDDMVRPVANENAIYGDQNAFQWAASRLGQLDAAAELCQGSRPAYRDRYEALVAAAYPQFLDAAMSLYDMTYRTISQSVQAGAESCTDTQSKQLEQIAETYFAMLEP
jgi:hypothetical protein